MRHDKDNMIDWSAFDEKTAATGSAPGAPLFRVFAVILFAVAIGGTIIGGMSLNEAFRILGSETAATGTIVSAELQSQFYKSIATIGLSLATLVPACFALSSAAQRKGFLSHLLIAVCGIVLSGLAFVAGIAFGTEEASAIEPLWAVFTVLAIAYLVVACMVSWNSRTTHGGHSAKKEALWDEKEIWKSDEQ